MMNSQQLLDSVETKTERRECPRHGSHEAEFFRITEGGPWLGGKCQKCIDEREAWDKENERLEKEAEKKRILDDLMWRSGIPKRFKTRTLASYKAGNPGQQRALKIAQKMAESDPADGVSLVFCGKPGTGKTHLACGIALEWIQSMRSATFCTVLAAIRSIKSTYSRDSDRTEDEAISALTGVSLLVMDEVGVQLGTEHEKMLVFEIINERYQNMRPTILISNLTQSELTEYLGDRVMDRFRESGAVVAFDWESYRGSK